MFSIKQERCSEIPFLKAFIYFLILQKTANCTTVDYPSQGYKTAVNVTDDQPDCTTNTCVRKCCPEGKIFSYSPPNYGCVEPLPSEPKFELKFQFKDGRPDLPEHPLKILTGFPYQIGSCNTSPIPDHREALLLKDGTVYTAYETTKIRGTMQYCIDVLREIENPSKLTFFTCYTKFEETPRTLFRFYAHTICLILSIVALLLVVLFYVFLPKLRDSPGLCLLSHVCSLLVGNISLVTATLSNSMNDNMCVAIGIVLYFSFLATYMWLTVMCFDFWRSIRQSMSAEPSSTMKRWQKRRPFVIYSGVVWGTVTLLTVFTCIMDFLPEESLPDYIIRPHFGLNRCFIIDEDANLLVYFFLVLGILCLANVIFVSMTIYNLYRGGVKMCCLNRDGYESGTPTINTQHLNIFWQRFQIFALTTFLWTTEVLSWKIPPREMWELTDLLNTLQGVFIFMIFIRHPTNRKMIYDLCRRIMGRAQDTEPINSMTEDTAILD